MPMQERDVPRRLRRLFGLVFALAVCLVHVGCFKANVDATGYRKYWQPYVSDGAADDANDAPASDGDGDR